MGRGRVWERSVSWKEEWGSISGEVEIEKGVQVKKEGEG